MMRFLNPAGYVAAGVVLLLAVVLAWWLVLGRPAHDRRARVEAEGSAVVAKGAAAAAGDAIGVIAEGAVRDAAVDAQTGRNRDAIFAADNAGVPAGAAGAAGLRGLCQRPAYRDAERCRRMLQPVP